MIHASYTMGCICSCVKCVYGACTTTLRFPFMVGVCLVPSLTFVMLFSGIGFGFEVNQELRKYSFYSDGMLSLGVAIAVVGVLADFGSWQHIWKWLALLAETVATLCFIVGGTLTVDRYPAGNWNHQTRAALCVALTLALCVCVRSSDGRVSAAIAMVGSITEREVSPTGLEFCLRTGSPQCSPPQQGCVCL